jgi:ABC-2 type transport system permease protein
MSLLPEVGMESQEPGKALENAIPLTTRTGTVILGRMDFFSILLRLIGMELYKIRRSLMSKVLIAVAVGLALLVALTVGIEIAMNLHTPGITLASRISLSEPLRLPTALEMATTQGELNPAIILLIILIGSSAGSELGIGTVRLLFTRGPWRGQFLLAKYGAALVCALIGVLSMALLGVLAGQLFNVLSGVPQDWQVVNAVWVGHVLLYLLATVLHWCMYAVMAVFFGVLGRSTAAGIGGALTWFFAEPIISSILTAAGNFSGGETGVFLRALPDYFMGNNARALQLNQAYYLFGSPSSSQADLNAFITLVVYLVAFISLTWWLNESRDVTN